jgi:hypothetical protein
LLKNNEISIFSYGKSMLERFDNQVIVAATPDEKLRNKTSLPCPVRLLITHAVMPRMNGRELANHIIAMRHCSSKGIRIQPATHSPFDGAFEKLSAGEHPLIRVIVVPAVLINDQFPIIDGAGV